MAMEDLDFSGKAAAPPRPPAVDTSRPGEAPSLYDPKLALAFFKIAGTLEEFAAGQRIFVEEDKPGGFFAKGARMYLLLEGDVTLMLAGKPLELVLPGEIFGEMATIADVPRTATATARKNCRALVLDEKQFLHALQQLPEFALMLMSVLAQRLRRGAAKLAAAGRASVAALAHQDTLDKRMLKELQQELGDLMPGTGQAGQNIVTQGAVGVCMFVVTQGRVAISIDGIVLEHVGPGGVFGEMALIDGAGRSATATAETDSTWLMISREGFLAMIKSKPTFGLALLRSMSARVRHVYMLLRDETE